MFFTCRRIYMYYMYAKLKYMHFEAEGIINAAEVAALIDPLPAGWVDEQ